MAWCNFKKVPFFKRIVSVLEKYNYIYFLNANMMPLQQIVNEILPKKSQGLVVTKHPGFYSVMNPNQLPYDRNRNSKAFIPFEEGTFYFMGGFNGGTKTSIIQLINKIDAWTNED